ncbi:Vacuolar protein sorting-associated protein 52 [Saitoella coloradoensis]
MFSPSRLSLSRFSSRYQSRSLATTITPTEHDFSHVIIGGGVVGLAIASRIARLPGASPILLERNAHIGQETSSRNSEVIHAGIYYTPHSLKEKLCVKGKSMLYDYLEKHGLPYKNCGKWIVAQTPQEGEYLQKMHQKAQRLGVPTRFIGKEEAARLEPDVAALECALESSSTGIVDAHSLMTHLLGSFEDSGGAVAYGTAVTSITPLANGNSGYQISSRSSDGEEMTITTSSLINAAGLGAFQISNMLLPSDRHFTPHYCKGNYFSYSASHPRTQRLIYPVPKPDLAGLGTHLTLDLGGQVRFGPDTEWLPSNIDLSSRDLYRVSEDRLDEMYEAIKQYLPATKRSELAGSYSGIRPKLRGDGEGMSDFYIEHEEGFPGFVNLVGIESPGLTSSLAIAEMVEDMLR